MTRIILLFETLWMFVLCQLIGFVGWEKSTVSNTHENGEKDGKVYRHQIKLILTIMCVPEFERPTSEHTIKPSAANKTINSLKSPNHLRRKNSNLQWNMLCFKIPWNKWTLNYRRRVVGTHKAARKRFKFKITTISLKCFDLLKFYFCLMRC